MSQQESLAVYKRYLKKFEDKFGEVDFEQPVQNQGKLIFKLKYDDFMTKWKELKSIESYLKETMTKGYTLNDEINRSYAELSATVLENPKDFMLF